jgi:hypothetical protein
LGAGLSVGAAIGGIVGTGADFVATLAAGAVGFALLLIVGVAAPDEQALTVNNTATNTDIVLKVKRFSIFVSSS